MASTKRSVASTGVLPVPALRLSEISPMTGRWVTTDWHRWSSSAVLMAVTATGRRSPLAFASTLPYWANPSPLRLSAETLNCCPETANDAASAPLARAMPRAAVPARAGTDSTANFRQLMRPVTGLPCASFIVVCPLRRAVERTVETCGGSAGRRVRVVLEDARGSRRVSAWGRTCGSGADGAERCAQKGELPSVTGELNVSLPMTTGKVEGGTGFGHTAGPAFLGRAFACTGWRSAGTTGRCRRSWPTRRRDAHPARSG